MSPRPAPRTASRSASRSPSRSRLARLGLLAALLLGLGGCGGAMPSPARAAEEGAPPAARPDPAEVERWSALDFEALSVTRAPAGRDPGDRGTPDDDPTGEAARAAFGVHPTVATSEQPHLRWPLRLDRDGFARALADLGRGRWPAPEHLRTESFIQAGHELGAPPTPRPTRGAPVDASPDAAALTAVAWPSPHRPGYHLLHVAVHPAAAQGPLRVVVLLPGGAPLTPAARDRVQRGLGHLATGLGRGDEIAVLGGSAAGLTALLPPTPATDRARLGRALESWQPEQPVSPTELWARAAALEGGFAGAVGRVLCFAEPPRLGRAALAAWQAGLLDDPQAAEPARTGGTAVVMLGPAPDEPGPDEPGPDPGPAAAAPHLGAQLGAALLHAGTAAEVRALFGQQLPAALAPAAHGVGLHLALDPHQVLRHRPLGFERLRSAGPTTARAGLPAERAGHVPSGGALTALFEVKLVPTAPTADRDPPPPWATVRATGRAPPGGSAPAALGTLHLAAADRVPAAAAPTAARLAAWTAAFGEKLADAWWSRTVTWPALRAELAAIESQAHDPDLARRLTGVRAALDRAEALDAHRPKRRTLAGTANDFDDLPMNALHRPGLGR